MDKSIFQKKINENLQRLTHYFETLPWENEDFYNCWLAQTHAYVSYTEVFLKMCTDRVGEGHALKKHFDHHLEEEVGHDKLSENDIKFMESPRYPVFGLTGVFWKSQFYWIKEHGPTAHLGYSLFLEGLAAISGPKILRRVQKAGHKGYTFLKVHAEEDTSHYETAIGTALKLTDLERKNIFQNMSEGMETYMAILKKCEDFALNSQAA